MRAGGHRRRWVVAFAALFVTTLVTAQEQIPPELQALVDTERAFAGAATVKGLRDSFLDYFADDAITFVPQAASAKENLRKQPSQPFSVLEIVWEPRTGDIASSGDLGWLAGPSTIINRASPRPTPRYGNYLSVWRKQPDGRWRVYIDVGAGMPELPPFAPGFTRTPFGPRYKGTDGKEAATRSLLEADRDLNHRAGTLGIGKAYAERLTPASRLHRAGHLPVIGRDAIAAWLTENAASMSATSTAGEASAAGDFGYSYGTYQVKGAAVETGAYVRVWSRDASGKWLVVADVTQPVRVP
jgi:ketosteroid isomerase-like protein